MLKEVNSTYNCILKTFFTNADSGIGMCQSEYLEQPPDQLSCNPYLNMELKLECTVSLHDAGTLSGRTVDWFHSTSALGDLQPSTDNPLAISRLDNAQENITIREQVMARTSSVRVRSRLEVMKLNEMNIGQYWCGIRIDSMEWMVLSDPVLLQDLEYYVNLEPCSTDSAQSKLERKCATWSFNSQTTPLQSTETPSVLPTHPTSEDLLPIATTSTQNGTTTESTEEEQVGNSPSMGFYIAIGIMAALVSISTALVSLVACMYIKYRKVLRGKLLAIYY
jgi:hypothetical protein